MTDYQLVEIDIFLYLVDYYYMFFLIGLFLVILMHGFMPIQIDVVTQDDFLRWLATRG